MAGWRRGGRGHTAADVADRRSDADQRAEPSISIVLPIPGDVRGLAAGTPFERDALAAGEAMIVAGEAGSAIGLVPEFDYDEPESGELSAPDQLPQLCALSWTVYSLPGVPVAEHLDLGEAEYALRSAVRSAADTLTAIRATGGIDVADPRGMVEQLLECARAAPSARRCAFRALRVLENAAHVDAIISVSAGLMPMALRRRRRRSQATHSNR